MNQTRSLSEFTLCPKLTDLTILTLTNWIRATPCAICKAGSLFWSSDRVARITHIIGYITNASATWCCDHTIGQIRWGWTLNCKCEQIFLRMEDSIGQDKQIIVAYNFDYKC